MNELKKNLKKNVIDYHMWECVWKILNKYLERNRKEMLKYMESTGNIIRENVLGVPEKYSGSTIKVPGKNSESTSIVLIG